MWDLNAEAGRDGLDPVAEEPGQPLRVALRLGEADAQRLDMAVNPPAEQVEAPGANPALCQRRA